MVYGVKFNSDNKTYNFKSDNKYSINSYVIVETSKGLQYGKITRKSNINTSDDLESIIRLASDEDYNIFLNNLKLAKEALVNARDEAKNLI